MSRKEKIETWSKEIFPCEPYCGSLGVCSNCSDAKLLRIGAEWADANPISETFTYSDQEHQRLERSLERIAGMCGAPDASEACRNILKEVKRVLARV